MLLEQFDSLKRKPTEAVPEAVPAKQKKSNSENVFASKVNQTATVTDELLANYNRWTTLRVNFNFKAEGIYYTPVDNGPPLIHWKLCQHRPIVKQPLTLKFERKTSFLPLHLIAYHLKKNIFDNPKRCPWCLELDKNSLMFHI